MTTQITRWSPDTCECIIDYKWDDTEPSETRQHYIHEVVKACPDHKHLEGKDHHYNTVLEENQRKNRTHGEIGIETPITWEYTGQAPNRTVHIYHADTKKKLAEVAKDQDQDKQKEAKAK